MTTTADTPFGGAFRGKTVLVTGHTGFKGGWLTLWLSRLGAKVVGYALAPEPGPSLFEAAHVPDGITHIEGDVRDRAHLDRVLAEHRPELVLHLAAQPLVLLSYEEPVETFDTNVMGTVHVLDAVRRTPGVKACVVVTSDKCYENREWPYAYRENDPMGGHDPYSASKGAAEIVTAAYRSSFFATGEPTAIASARAGNVIGGGDWARDRIIPDCVRALSAGRPITVRNPDAVRPWQHVLEPLAGYLWVAARLLEDPARFDEAWNFGPAGKGNVPVRDVVARAIAAWGSGSWQGPAERQAPHEAKFLKLDIAKTLDNLAWLPLLEVGEAIDWTIGWYRRVYEGEDARAVTLGQIAEYERLAAERQVAWGAQVVGV